MTKQEIIEEIKNNLIAIKGKNEHIEALELFTVTNLIDKILNDFESRICKNCKYFEGGYCTHMENTKMNEDTMVMVNENFGCNRFERREK